MTSGQTVSKMDTQKLLNVPLYVHLDGLRARGRAASFEWDMKICVGVHFAANWVSAAPGISRRKGNIVWGREDFPYGADHIFALSQKGKRWPPEEMPCRDFSKNFGLLHFKFTFTL